jgi:hypothetical protein
LDATHFRQRAARARELAQTGDDVRLSRMLLDVALDLDAEAAAIEAETMTEHGGPRRARRSGRSETLLTVTGADENVG